MSDQTTTPETPQPVTKKITPREVALNIGRFLRFLGVRVVLNIIFSPIVALILVAIGFIWTSTLGQPNSSVVATTRVLWLPLQLISLAILGGLMWGAMEAARRFLCKLGLPLMESPRRLLRLLTIGGWLMGSVALGQVTGLLLPYVEAWNAPMWLALFVATELTLYFAIELTLCRMFPRLKLPTGGIDPEAEVAAVEAPKEKPAPEVEPVQTEASAEEKA